MFGVKTFDAVQSGFDEGGNDIIGAVQTGMGHHRQAAGLRSVSAPDNQMFSDRDSRTGSYSCHQMLISNLAAFIEDYLQVPVVDRTGLAGRFDIDIKGDSTPNGLKQVIQNELGLELVPSREPVEMLVVEKVK